MSASWKLSRRHFLRGLGASIALPSLDVMAAAAQAPAHPTRMAFFFVPNGVNMPKWRPAKAGANYQLSPTLAPLASLKNDFMVLSGLTQGA